MAWLGESENLFQLLEKSRRCSPGGFGSQQVRGCLSWRLREQSSQWQVAHVNSCFTRRVTSLRWHPCLLNTVAYGTHAGDIVLWDYNKPEPATGWPKIEGVGMGYGCITEMRFHPQKPNLIYTTAVDGKFCLQDFEGRQSQVWLDTNTLDYWWCSVDYSLEHGVLLVGDNRGSAVLLDMNTHSTIRHYQKLHKGKIKYIEFCPARSWMLVTTSVDRTIRFWDIRMLRCNADKPRPLSTAEHGGVVSSAYFDPIHGTRLLTTAQNGEIRVYDPEDLWEEPRVVVPHPHRSFQHMTDIRATWHPLYQDMCVVGRYPKKDDPDQSRTVDLMDLKLGERCGFFYSSQLSGLIQLNQFNRSGECLASGMGYHGLIWKAPEGVSRVTAGVGPGVLNEPPGTGLVLGDIQPPLTKKRKGPTRPHKENLLPKKKKLQL